jgi:preprotein translocase subunit SecA
MNKQREAIYGLRREVLTNSDLRDLLISIHFEAIRNEINEFGDKNRSSEEWDLDGFLNYLQRMIPYANFKDMLHEVEGLTVEQFMDVIMPKVSEAFEAKRAQLGDDLLLRLARYVVLRRIDDNWRDHLLAIDDLRESIGWRGYAQLDPLIEYQKEASLMFEELMFNTHKEVLEHFFLTQPAIQLEQQPPDQQIRGMEARKATLEETLPSGPPPQEELSDEEIEADGNGGRPPAQRPQNQPFRAAPKVGRNDPCPCGSGKKYKKCCGSAAQSGDAEVG